MPETRLDAFMASANAAYYATHDPFADFTTAPEIGQVFGELLGAWAAIVWQQLGAPDPVILAEAGPGRGTLMADALRLAACAASDFHAAARPHFIETSPRLRAIQARAVPSARGHEALEDLPHGPLILLANEFLDALPIRQFVRGPSAWAERWVAGGRFVLRPGAPPGHAAPEGTILELNEPAQAWVAHLAARLSKHGGAALILDYGHAQARFGDTLQALKAGRPADPLADPGHADLTAHVDFAAVSHAAGQAGGAIWGPIDQGVFLDRLGLQPRTGRLSAANPARAAALREAADRLAAPARMGALFKALAITHPAAPPPPGFEP